MKIGPHPIAGQLIVAPMAGVTDRGFRQMCKKLGAGMAVSEMTSSNSALWNTAKSRRRLDHQGEVAPISVQIAGADPRAMAEAARYNVDQGAQIIDINMGCPAKKVCQVAAGSALLRDEPLVGRILDAVVAAVGVPVTLKIRTGWDTQHRNAVRVAKLAQSAGIAALSIHGRTRACGFGGEAEYSTIAQVKSEVGIPVIANGDIDSPEKARLVLDQTGADAVMIGRAAQGRPWIFREIRHYLEHGRKAPAPELEEIHQLVAAHLHGIHELYGENPGVRVARKHVSWYLKNLPAGRSFLLEFYKIEDAARQLAALDGYFAAVKQQAEACQQRMEELAA